MRYTLERQALLLELSGTPNESLRREVQNAASERVCQSCRHSVTQVCSGSCMAWPSILFETKPFCGPG